ncbi:MFS transporter [Sulfobacillus thermosulfidooxidans]|uniref:MFS transporter n=1 Tax=Sulfobacillus benefaciens TaxID=453960 RepID=A0A2T2WKB5_9FIRM|nr:MFS transporter [Sulfobacillus thermosulfidooxidans]PSR22665.1 MAG: MFS transporter [Sulfobacillus benefaciens]
MTKNVFLYVLTDTLASGSDVISSMATALLAVDLGRSSFQSGLILFSASIPYLLFGLVGGVVADRVEKRRLMMGCDLIRATVLAFISLSAAFHRLTVPVLIGALLLATSVRAFYFPARKGLTPDLVADAVSLSQLNLYVHGTESLGGIIMPIVGSVMLLWTHAVADLFWIPVITLLLSALAVSLLRLPEQRPTLGATPFSDLKHGLVLVFSQRSPLPYLVTAFATAIVAEAGVIKIALPKILTAMHLSHNVSYGLAIGLMASAEVGMSFLWVKRRASRSLPWIFGGYGVRAGGLALLAIALGIRSLPLLIGAIIVQGIGMPISGPPLTTALQTYTPRPLMGKVMAIRSTIGNLSDSASYLLIGGLLEVLSLDGVLWVSMTLAGLSALTLWILWSRHPVSPLWERGQTG